MRAVGYMKRYLLLAILTGLLTFSVGAIFSFHLCSEPHIVWITSKCALIVCCMAFQVYLCTVKPVFKTTWEIGTAWELRRATSVSGSIHYIEMDLRSKTTSEFRTVFDSPLGVPNSQVPLYIHSDIIPVYTNPKCCIIKALPINYPQLV